MKCWLAGLLTANLTFAAPDIDSISPLAIRPGVPTEIVLSGTDLSEATQLWTSFPAQVERLDDARFRVTAKTSVGIGALRAFGSNGVSNPVLIMVDDLPGLTESKTNKTRATAQAIEFGSAVDGSCDQMGFDWFKLRVNKGQRVSLEIMAARIGSKLDSVVRVVNAAGRELARNDDASGWSGDSYVSLVATESGDYFIEVRDVNYGGGSEFFYRLRVGDFPLAAKRLIVPAPKISVGDVGEVTEREPNDTVAKATKISLPAGINGRFDKLNDRDCYGFSAHKGERIEFRAATRSLGSPCDAMMQLDSADGKRLARSNPAAADEGVLAYAFTSDGVYRLIVEEANGAFGSNMVYRINTQRSAGFALSLDTDRVNVAPGKTFDLKVNVTRGDYKGAVTLALEGLPEAFVITNNIIADGKSNTTMKVTAPESLIPGTWQQIGVFGSAKRNGEEVRVRASTGPAMRKRWPLLLYPPAEFDGIIALGVTQPK